MSNEANIINKKDTLNRLLIYGKDYLWLLVISLICCGVASLCSVVPAYVVKDLVNEVLVNKKAQYIIKISELVIGVMFIKGVFSFSSMYLMQYATQRILLKIRSDCFDKLLKLSLSFFESQQTGQLMLFCKCLYIILSDFQETLLKYSD